MTDDPQPQQAHKSAELGAKSMLLGLLGSVIAYFGLWIESDMTGLVGWGTVGIAVIGGLISLFWYIGANLRDRLKSR
ncbi:hypothetical protein MNBD_GAMMA26-2441 [hydrothermal vent metagenome]|uniref:ATP synthase protein I n=1 Tax=hydrothermal vent metagenome TaxID=652676 RepID=A0A3B1B8Y9_9ZZZZ